MIPIFIPYVNRPDLLRKAVESVPLNDHEWQVEVINNSGAPLPDDICAGDCNPHRQLTFTETQNWMLHLALLGWNAPFYLFMHSDAEAEPGTVEALIAMAHRLENEDRKWAVIFTAYDALAAFNTAAFQAIGGWDEGFQWYASDTDVYRRLRLAGYEMIESGLPVKHEPSQTLNSDPEIARQVSEEFPNRVKRYIEKWGGDIGQEIFTKPWNS